MLMYEIEVVERNRRKQPSRKQKKASKTGWERNLTKLRSKERELDPQKPVKPVRVD